MYRVVKFVAFIILPLFLRKFSGFTLINLIDFETIINLKVNIMSIKTDINLI